MTRRKDEGLPGNRGQFTATPRGEAEVDLDGDRNAARIRTTLGDILDFAATAQRLVDRGRPAYDDDEMLRLAAEAVVHKIGEAVSRLPDEFTKAHASVPWRAMKGTRNTVAHQYEIVDYELIWSAMEDHLPQNAAAIRDILDQMP